jgi:fumarate reductase flavoprotein subunit
LERKAVEILLGTKGVELYRDRENRVSGISAIDQDTNRPLAIKARRAVILTSGSLEGSPQLRARATSPEIAAIPAAVSTNDGSGLIMATALGADMTMLEGFGIPFLRGMPPGPCVGIEKQAWMRYGIVDAGAILLNNKGKRFVNEKANSIDLCLSTSCQPDKTRHLVFDQRIASIFNKWPMVISSIPGIAPVSKIGGFGLVDDFVEWNAIRRAGTVEDLAAAVGIDPDGMSEEIVRWNRFCKERVDSDFNRKSFGVDPAGAANAGLITPPYYCHSPLRALVVLADTSLAINTKFQVLDVFGKIIPRLYAAGNAGHGDLVLFGPGHGMHMSWAFTSGRLSGKLAADEPHLD